MACPSLPSPAAPKSWTRPASGSLGGTYCGHPASCAAALAAIETIEKDGLLARSTAIGEHFEKRARGWQKKWPLVGDVRGLGGMCAMELVRNAETREPADAETKEIAKYCYEHGLILITAGTFNNVIRILVPLVVTDEQFDEGLDVIEAALAARRGTQAGCAFSRVTTPQASL